MQGLRTTKLKYTDVIGSEKENDIFIFLGATEYIPDTDRIKLSLPID